MNTAKLNVSELILKIGENQATPLFLATVF
jgi:hypothetical protein